MAQLESEANQLIDYSILQEHPDLQEWLKATAKAIDQTGQGLDTDDPVTFFYIAETLARRRSSQQETESAFNQKMQERTNTPAKYHDFIESEQILREIIGLYGQAMLESPPEQWQSPIPPGYAVIVSHGSRTIITNGFLNTGIFSRVKRTSVVELRIVDIATLKEHKVFSAEEVAQGKIEPLANRKGIQMDITRAYINIDNLIAAHTLIDMVHQGDVSISQIREHIKAQAPTQSKTPVS